MGVEKGFTLLVIFENSLKIAHAFKSLIVRASKKSLTINWPPLSQSQLNNFLSHIIIDMEILINILQGNLQYVTIALGT